MANSSIAISSTTYLDDAKSLANSRAASVLVAFTADDANGSVPTLAITGYQGWMLYEVRTDPGSTAPTANYDITLIDEFGIDIAGGQLLNRHTSTSERVALIDPPILRATSFTITLANNAVNSATGQICFFLARVS